MTVTTQQQHVTAHASLQVTSVQSIREVTIYVTDNVPKVPKVPEHAFATVDTEPRNHTSPNRPHPTLLLLPTTRYRSKNTDDTRYAYSRNPIHARLKLETCPTSCPRYRSSSESASKHGNVPTGERDGHR
ncbi:hypothetical protein PMIN03_009118 [Paraphaeosphaeria minitans]